MKSFAVMLTFFTRVPIRIKSEIQYDDYIKGIWWLPLISIIIGLPLYLLGLLRDYTNIYLLSTITLIVYLLLSGGLHIDGMADTMDAYGSNRSKSRMLEIMKDSSIGTFGVLAIVVYSLSFVMLTSNIAIYGLLLMPLVGRSTALLVARYNNYAREMGMGKSFVDGAKLGQFIVSFVVYLIVLFFIMLNDFILINYIIGVGAFILTVGIIFIKIKVMSKKIDGITGDIIGFTIELSQLSYLFILYILNVCLM